MCSWPPRAHAEVDADLSGLRMVGDVLAYRLDGALVSGPVRQRGRR
ncbi:hypothetical protein [Streptomyces sp. CoH27]|nr:hypothetical protein [Streptomyces sp. CoH27]